MAIDFGFRDASVCAICRCGRCSCDTFARLHGVRPIGHSSDEDDEGAGDDRAFSLMFEQWLNDPDAWYISDIIDGTEEKRAREHRHRNYNRKQDIKRGKISGKPTGWKQQSIDEAKAKGLPPPSTSCPQSSTGDSSPL